MNESEIVLIHKVKHWHRTIAVVLVGSTRLSKTYGLSSLCDFHSYIIQK